MAKKLYNEISNEELKALTGAIKSRYGIDFTNYETKSLKRGFARLISKNGMETLLDLWGKVLRDREFLMGCIDDLTVNLTELFRNPDFWVRLHDEVLEDVKSKYRTINMWHAGCSTGEEVYSMAVVLEDKGMLYRTKTWATDLSSTALAKAIEGRYPATLVTKYEKGLIKYLPHKNMSDMFKFEEKHIRVKDKYKKHIDFHQHNLVQDKVDRKFNIVFCRNVMIYFDEHLKMRVLKLIYDSLEDDGYLILGYYDMFSDEAKKLFKVYDAKTRIYKKIASN